MNENNYEGMDMEDLEAAFNPDEAPYYNPLKEEEK